MSYEILHKVMISCGVQQPNKQTTNKHIIGSCLKPSSDSFLKIAFSKQKLHAVTEWRCKCAFS